MDKAHFPSYIFIPMKKNLVRFTLVFAFTLNSPALADKATFPGDFLWGAAFSAHQTEGVTGGGENGDWWRFEHPTSGGPNIANGDTADVSIDHWNRFEDDLQAAKSIGLNTFRTSVAWEKIEPAQGQFNKAAIEHYRTVLKRAHQLGLRPMIALHHFVNPNWFQDRGGWEAPDSAGLFADYARYVVTQLGDLCDLWITFNEPMIFVEMGYLKGEMPPLKTGIESAFEAAYNTVRAHRLSVTAMHEANINAQVGLAYAFELFDPLDPQDAGDVRAASELSHMANWVWLNAAETGHLEFHYSRPGLSPKVVARDLPREELQKPYKMDWLGVNFYNRFLIKDKLNPILPFDWVIPPGIAGDNGWPIFPEELERVVRAVATHYKYPLLITECGLADGVDSRRPDFIRKNMIALDRLREGSEMGPPLDIRGYYHWSLVDNYEWLHGYKYRFGLFEVQYDNGLKRVPRPSAFVYADEIRKRKSSWRVLMRRLFPRAL